MNRVSLANDPKMTHRIWEHSHVFWGNLSLGFSLLAALKGACTDLLPRQHKPGNTDHLSAYFPVRSADTTRSERPSVPAEPPRCCSCCAARLLDLQDLGDVLPHLHAAALWIKKKRKKKSLLVLQWIAKAPSCGSELVFLDLYPESPAAKQSRERERRASLCRLTPAEGGVLKSGGGCECVSVCGSCAGWSLGCFLGSHTLRRDHLWAKHTEMQRLFVAHLNNLCKTLHACWCFPTTVMFLYMHKKKKIIAGLKQWLLNITWPLTSSDSSCKIIEMSSPGSFEIWINHRPYCERLSQRVFFFFFF